ncbi:MAG: glycoside hydrolase family 3 C-terminal domain-containing protein [Bacteroidetes bacterium]|nr:glycoside hydrolase family 3 C-terminal domain-containing protein [Bacteroidota bacterium]
MISVYNKGLATLVISVLMTVTGNHPVYSQHAEPYRNPSLPVEKRVQDLLGRMSPEEKFYQLFMVPGDLTIGKDKLKHGLFGLQVTASGQTSDGAGQMLTYSQSASAAMLASKINDLQRFFVEETRLGIPIIPFEEALHGLVCRGATAFPQSIGLAASFDVELMHKVAKAIAAETRSRGIRQILSPVLNIARDVRWGRTEETYGEDPYLVSRMGLSYISKFEKAGIIATPKHFAMNAGDGGRDSYPIHYSERLMEEIYFPAFKTATGQAGARSLMTAYNSFDGSPCSANNWLLNKKLKREWGFQGFVISDACAVGGANVLHFTATGYAEAGKQAIENGLDVIFQTDISHAELFSEPFFNGTVRQGAIDSAVTRVLLAKFELGLFENPWVDTAESTSPIALKDHRETALQAARESIVLLKNDGNILPVSPGMKTIAVIGTDAAEARLGGYSSEGNNKISILEGIRQAAPRGVKVMYSPGCGRATRQYVIVPGENLCSYLDNKKSAGLRAEYFNNINLEGTAKVTRTDATVDFGWTLYGPDPAIPADWYSARWTGKITGSANGKYKIGIEGNDGYRLYLDGRLVLDNWVKKSHNTLLTDFSFVKGQEYDLRLEYFECTGNARLKLIWNAGLTDTIDETIRKTAEMAALTDIIIVVAGIEEGEFRDRSSLKLPGKQEDLIHSLSATGKPVVVILVGGSAVTMNNWIAEIAGLVDAWYPGEAGGIAVADVLFGRFNPAGRLPVTFPVSEGQLPLVYNHKPTGRGDDYNDLSGMPLFPFGYGLSYTTFEYSNLRFDQDTIGPSDSTVVRFKVKNTGKIAGDEVCQLYIHDELASVSRPVTELKGFDRIHLEAGETKEVVFCIAPDALSMLNVTMKQVVEPGKFRIMIGTSSKDIRLRGFLTVDWE